MTFTSSPSLSPQHGHCFVKIGASSCDVFIMDSAKLLHSSYYSKQNSPKPLTTARKGPACRETRNAKQHSHDATPSNLPSPTPGSSPSRTTLHAIGIGQLLIINLRIVPAHPRRRRIIDIKVSLHLPIDIDHRAIGAVVRDQNLDARRPSLHLWPARNAAHEVTRQHRTKSRNKG